MPRHYQHSFLSTRTLQVLIIVMMAMFSTKQHHATGFVFNIIGKNNPDNSTGNSPTLSYFEQLKQDKLIRKENDRQLVLRKHEELARTQAFDSKARFASNTLLFCNSLLLLKGGLSLPVLVSSSILLKLLDTYCRDDKNTGVGYKVITSVIFSGLAFSFNSRSIEKLGGVVLIFVQWMSIPWE
mmetsp:Transcript_14518/g.21789  ORF Transcript_14518/g.21789 Transcript_14518/m.21789 type:complete len:183 (-) Transcript_14518:103-651(-)